MSKTQKAWEDLPQAVYKKEENRYYKLFAAMSVNKEVMVNFVYEGAGSDKGYLFPYPIRHKNLQTCFEMTMGYLKEHNYIS